MSSELQAVLVAPLDPAQLKRIEAVHRWFLYEHRFEVGCLLRASSSGARTILIEHDEDMEVVVAVRCIRRVLVSLGLST